MEILILSFTFTHLIIALFIVLFITILYIRYKQRRDDTLRDLGYNSIIDAVTLNSGIIILLYTIGKYFSIDYLITDVDNYALLKMKQE